MTSTTTASEDYFGSLSAASKAEKLDALLKHEVRKERLKQRSQDEDLDHPIALYSRQKKREPRVLLATLAGLTFIHGVQLVALYNYNALSGVILTETVNDYIERRYWFTNNATLQQANPAVLHREVRLLLGGSEIPVVGSMQKFGFCLTPEGYSAAIFDTVVGLFFIYLFIFADVWKVVFNTIITRNFPEDPNFKLSLSGSFWLVCLNAAILTWLGVESGFAVIASHGDFYSVLFNALNIFIILAIDDTVLPLLRFLVEDWGHLDAQGEMSDERLKLITHGTQYHKPGYGQHWVANLHEGVLGLRVVAVLNILVVLAIIIAPLAVTISKAASTFVKC